MPREKTSAEELLKSLKASLADLESVRTVSPKDPSLSKLKESLRRAIRQMERRAAAEHAE